MAAAAGLSPYHFIRAFHVSEGQTPHVWVSAGRLDLALRMLIEGGRVDDIADRADTTLALTFRQRLPAPYGCHTGGRPQRRKLNPLPLKAQFFDTGRIQSADRLRHKEPFNEYDSDGNRQVDCRRDRRV